ncbi:MAG: hypothetical protein Q7K57_25020 [Burkholderiaceae bacterium]|nr:hypothetical protein [Burkholderiaceae bacterium]
MTDITQTDDSYPEGVYLLAVTDPVLGGPEGPDNKAAIALTNRTHYQRMRNVTPWRGGAEHPYPAHAYVQHAGVTWKSVAANADIEPGTDATKWERWAFTQDELDAYMATFLPYGAPPACPATGPIGTDNKAKIYKSALGEYWMWVGDVWRVIAGHLKLVTTGSFVNSVWGSRTVTCSLTMPRAGRVLAVADSNGTWSGSTATMFMGGTVGRTGDVRAMSLSYVTSNGYESSTAGSALLDVAAGDVVFTDIGNSSSSPVTVSGNSKLTVIYQ